MQFKSAVLLFRRKFERRPGVKQALNNRSRRAQRPVANNGETRPGVVLPEQREAVHGKRLEFKAGKALAQYRKHALAPDVAEPAGERHVEAEFLHDIGIPPAVKIFDLTRRQLRRISPRAILGRERRTKAIEGADAIGGELFEQVRPSLRNDGDEAADGI